MNKYKLITPIAPKYATTWLHWLAPAVALLAATFYLDVMHGDFYIADWLYAKEGMQWSLKHNTLLQNVIHDGGRKLITVMVVSLLVVTVISRFNRKLRPWHADFLRLLASISIAMIVISLLKHITHIDCPWAMDRYGGSEPTQAIATALFGSGSGQCFPAGHASGAYAWVALYFFFMSIKPQWRFYGLGFGLLLGATFGFAQQLRGAHFLSHDLWTQAICWYTAMCVHTLGYATVKPLSSPLSGAPS